MMLDSLPLYANCLCAMRVFSYANIHTITMRLVSCFSPSDPLPIFQDSRIPRRGCIIMLRVLLYGCFFHSTITTGVPTLCVSITAFTLPSVYLYKTIITPK
jgi:hypothetical protein